jgi:hypothetical protein
VKRPCNHVAAASSETHGDCLHATPLASAHPPSGWHRLAACRDAPIGSDARAAEPVLLARRQAADSLDLSAGGAAQRGAWPRSRDDCGGWTRARRSIVQPWLCRSMPGVDLSLLTGARRCSLRKSSPSGAR